MKLTGIEDEMKRQLIKQLLYYLDRSFSIQLKLFVAHDRKELGKILDIPEYLTRDLAAGFLKPAIPCGPPASNQEGEKEGVEG